MVCGAADTSAIVHTARGQRRGFFDSRISGAKKNLRKKKKGGGAGEVTHLGAAFAVQNQSLDSWNHTPAATQVPSSRIVAAAAHEVPRTSGQAAGASLVLGPASPTPLGVPWCMPEDPWHRRSPGTTISSTRYPTASCPRELSMHACVDAAKKAALLQLFSVPEELGFFF